MPSNGPLSTRQASAVGSQDSLLTLPPPLPAQPPRLGTLSLHPAASTSSSSASAADEWGSVFEVLESSRSTTSAEEGEVKALEDGLTKRCVFELLPPLDPSPRPFHAKSSSVLSTQADQLARLPECVTDGRSRPR